MSSGDRSPRCATVWPLIFDFKSTVQVHKILQEYHFFNRLRDFIVSIRVVAVIFGCAKNSGSESVYKTVTAIFWQCL